MNKVLKIFNIASAVILVLFGAFYALMSSVYFTTSNAPLMIIGVVSVVFAAGLLRSQLKSDEGEIRDVEGEKIYIEPAKWSPALSLIVFSAHIFMLPNIFIATEAPFYINVFCCCTTVLSLILIVTSLVRQKLLGKAESFKKRVIVIVILAVLITALSGGKYALFANTQQHIDNAGVASEYLKGLSAEDLPKDLPAAETIRNEITASLDTTVYYALKKGTEQQTDSSGKTYIELLYYVWTAEDINVSEFKYWLYDDGTAKFRFASGVDGLTAADFASAPYFVWENN